MYEVASGTWSLALVLFVDLMEVPSCPCLSMRVSLLVFYLFHITSLQQILIFIQVAQSLWWTPHGSQNHSLLPHVYVHGIKLKGPRGKSPQDWTLCPCPEPQLPGQVPLGDLPWTRGKGRKTPPGPGLLVRCRAQSSVAQPEGFSASSPRRLCRELWGTQFLAVSSPRDRRKIACSRRWLCRSLGLC